jgi:glycosyltransferase involved in cell wall biosynthesis
MKKIVMCLTTYNRYDILKESLNSLSKTNFPDNCCLMIQDDYSTDIRIRSLLDSLKLEIPVKLCYNSENLGCDRNVMSSITNAFNSTDEDYVLVLDSDAFYHPDWLNKTLELLEEDSIGMATTFNTPKHPVIKEEDRYYQKRSLGGFCVALRRDVFENIPDTLEWDWKANMVCGQMGLKIITSKESYVEHIGVVGTHCRPGSGKTADKANNFIGDKESSDKIRKEKINKKY